MSIDIATLKSRSGVNQVIESGIIRYTLKTGLRVYGFLLVFYSNFVPKRRTVFEIFDFKNVVT